MQKRNVSIVLRELLDRDRISPTELHRRTGVPQSTLSRILSGKIVDPSDKHISRIAEYFRVSLTRKYSAMREMCLSDGSTILPLRIRDSVD